MVIIAEMEIKKMDSLKWAEESKLEVQSIEKRDVSWCRDCFHF